MTDVKTIGAEPSGSASEVPADQASRPEHVPEKFWDASTGTIRTDLLLRSYLELERKLGRVVPKPDSAADPAQRDHLLALLGRPAAPEDYVITPAHPLLEADQAVNAKLHAAGFTQHQAQLVYELAAERLLPLIQAALDDLEARRQIDQLQGQFGGPAGWRETARQLKAWASAHLSDDVLETLATSFEGVLALHHMMRAAEPELMAVSGDPAGTPTAAALSDMIRDPRYWRDRNADFVARVTTGFRRLYPA